MKLAAPVTAVIATRNRVDSLASTLESVAAQGLSLGELIVVDASDDGATRELVTGLGSQTETFASVRWLPATEAGAAAQRNQGVEQSTQPFVWFFDDDVRFEPGCAERLWRAMESDRTLGGVNAMIVNQRYENPGRASRIMFRLLNGKKLDTYAGRILGPALNLLPEDRPDLPEVVPVDWLNTTCTIYRREAMPSPPFDSSFVGYSLMEDVTLSLRVARNGWGLVNARTARIFHDSQPGEHKSDDIILSRMELINRHYVMTRVLDRTRIRDYFKLGILEAFSLLSLVVSGRSAGRLWRVVRGKMLAVSQLIRGNRDRNAPQ